MNGLAAPPFSPGSPAGDGGIAQAAMQSAIGGLSIPGFTSSATSSATSGDIYSTLGLDNSGFNVNFGNGVSQGTATPKATAAAAMAGAAQSPLILVIVAVLGVVWLKKKSA